MKLIFKELELVVIEELKHCNVAVLATSANDIVTARSMSFVSNGMELYFQTDKNFTKYEQLLMNPNVSVCKGNLQLEGVVLELGHPLNKDNIFFQEEFKSTHRSSFEDYSHLESEVLFKIIPKKVTLWKYEGKQALREVLDYSLKNAFREYYSPG